MIVPIPINKQTRQDLPSALSTSLLTLVQRERDYIPYLSKNRLSSNFKTSYLTFHGKAVPSPDTKVSPAGHRPRYVDNVKSLGMEVSVT